MSVGYKQRRKAIARQRRAALSGQVTLLSAYLIGFTRMPWWARFGWLLCGRFDAQRAVRAAAAA